MRGCEAADGGSAPGWCVRAAARTWVLGAAGAPGKRVSPFGGAWESVLQNKGCTKHVAWTLAVTLRLAENPSLTCAPYVARMKVRDLTMFPRSPGCTDRIYRGKGDRYSCWVATDSSLPLFSVISN